MTMPVEGAFSYRHGRSLGRSVQYGLAQWRLDFFFRFGSVRLAFLGILSELIGVAVCSVL
jgi:hypothetical protein